MDFLIRRAVPADRDALLNLIRDHALFEGAEATLTPDQLAAVLQASTPPTEVFVAARHSGLLGYAALTYDYALWRAQRWAHLDCLFVGEAYRGLSVGNKLFDVVMEEARKEGADRLEWQTPAWNERAIGFYRSRNAKGVPKMRFGINL